MRKIFLIALICLNLGAVLAQTDTVTISNVPPDSIDIKYDRVYRLFVEENNQEIRHLFKVNLVDFRLFEPNLVFEQKIGKSFSSETGIKLAFTTRCHHYLNDDLQQYAPITQYIYNGYCLSSYEKIKFYYNLNYRQRREKKTNGFSGNYFSLHLAALYANGTISGFDFFDNNYEEFVFAYGIGYGLQRRIGNIGYFEPSFNLGILPTYSNFPENEIYFNINLNLNIGFSIESVSSLRKMLKK